MHSNNLLSLPLKFYIHTTVVLTYSYLVLMKKIASVHSLGDIFKLLDDGPTLSKELRESALQRQKNLLKPANSLGQLEDIAVFLSSWGKKTMKDMEKISTIVFAGNHGVCRQSVNPFPQEVTFQMVETFKSGKAAINKICELNGINLEVIPIDLDKPTADISVGPAMDETEFLDAFNIGLSAVSESMDLITLGEMGIGNTTIASALCYHFFNNEVSSWVGPGTGSTQNQIIHKGEIIEKAVKINKQSIGRPLQAGVVLGGREQAAICGAVVAAKHYSVPVILDGFICTAAVLPIFFERRDILDHCLIGHSSKEPGHQLLLKMLKKKPILNLDMALGEGSGAALATSIAKAAFKCHVEMATFEDAGVSGKQ